ncbi:MAG TPA: GNAT family N-acetyltransferase [Sphingobacteriaceae bacterium]|nr:GNAT family N-acetyltransferase [Sphingobacteriaceae bacterium]
MRPNNQIRLAETEDLATLQRLAHQIWWPTYSDFLPHAQIEKMLAEFYTPEALNAQMMAGHYFALWEKEGVPMGFVGFREKPSPELSPEPSPESSLDPRQDFSEEMNIMRIEKLYILPQCQGSGAGTDLLAYVARAAAERGIRTLELNVNRDNPAVGFYLKKGFKIIEEVNIPYPPYVLNDYIMQMEIVF